MREENVRDALLAGWQYYRLGLNPMTRKVGRQLGGVRFRADMTLSIRIDGHE